LQAISTMPAAFVVNKGEGGTGITGPRDWDGQLISNERTYSFTVHLIDVRDVVPQHAFHLWLIGIPIKTSTVLKKDGKKKLPVAPTTNDSPSSGSKDPAVIVPSKKVNLEDKSWWDTAQYNHEGKGNLHRRSSTFP